MGRIAARFLFRRFAASKVDDHFIQATTNGVCPSFQQWRTPTVALASSTGALAIDSRESFAVVFDGRLDNNDELAQRLGVEQSLDETESILACYQRWGSCSFNLLLGDFAFVLWDGPRRRLIAVRDAIGLRPLFYHHDSDRLICASSIRQLQRDAQTPRRLSGTAVANYLSGVPSLPECTFFERVQRLPAGHWLEASSDGAIRIHRYWNPESIPIIADKPPSWYADEFRERFTSAVHSRIRGSTPRIAVHVSGGLDSSAVTAQLHCLNRKLKLGLEPWAFINVSDHPAAQEVQFQKAVLDRYPMHVEETASKDYWAFCPAAPIHQLQDEPFESPYASRLVAELESARRMGINIILSGAGGDEVGGSSWYLLDLLMRGRIGQLWTEWSTRAVGRGITAYALSRILLSGVWKWLRRDRRRPAPPPDWLSHRLIEQRRLPRPLGISRGPTRDDFFHRLQFCWTEPLMSAGQGLYDHYGVEMRHPFLDRRLFEWALSVPPFRFGEEGRVKAPMRRALADLLPEAIRTRADKGRYLHYWDLGVRFKERDRILRLLDRPISAELGFIDPVQLRRAYERYCRGGPINRQHLWATITLEAWLRRRSGAQWA